MPQPLSGKVAVVTGAARRVGRAIMLGFANAGADVVIHHRSSGEEAQVAAEVARALGVKALVLRADLNDPEAIRAMFTEVKANFERVDVLVNSAASFQSGDLLDISVDEFDQVLHTNLRAPFVCLQEAGRMMRDHGAGGAIINIGDNSGVRAWRKRPQHSISKAGLIMLTKVAAKALAPHNIRVNCLVLGPILPGADTSEEAWRRTEARIPLGRGGTPSEVADAAVFMAMNAFITGAVLQVDGGEYLSVTADEHDD